MEPKRFDELAASVAKGETSRRSVLVRVGGGGLAALLATIGIGGLGVEEADARRGRRCKKRCKKKNDKDKRRKCKRRCRKKPSTPSGPGPECSGTGDCQGTDICVDNECVDRPETVLCTEPGDCTGSEACLGGICVLPCTDDEQCEGALLCINSTCLLDDECENDEQCDGLLQTCFLGVCLDPDDLDL